MDERILIPLDGSERAEQILTRVRSLLKQPGAEVILARSAYVAPSLARIDTAALAEQLRQVATVYLDTVTETLVEHDVRARSLLLRGPPPEAIVASARDVQATLIAMSTHGYSGIARWALGSVAERVIRLSMTPVLLMRSFRTHQGHPPIPWDTTDHSFDRILLSVDGSEESLAVLPALERIGKRFGSKISVLFVQGEPSRPLAEVVLHPTEEPEEIAGPIVERFRARGLDAKVLGARGDPASAIVETAESLDVDLIALSTHGRSGASRWVLGSVAEKVLRHAPKPILIARSRAHPAGQSA